MCAELETGASGIRVCVPCRLNLAHPRPSGAAPCTILILHTLHRCVAVFPTLRRRMTLADDVNIEEFVMAKVGWAVGLQGVLALCFVGYSLRGGCGGNAQRVWRRCPAALAGR